MTSDHADGNERRLGRYHLGELLGGGPTGVVYRATVFGVAGFERKFAIKRFHDDLVRSPANAAKVAGAARAYGGLEHPNIARLHEFGVAAGETFTATELVEGLDLRSLSRVLRGGLKPGSAARSLAMIAKAVGFGHARGHCHLGLCPTNVLITPSGELKVTDFGILGPRLPKRPAQDPTLDDRIPFLAPEQLAGEPTSAATDVFQLGVLGYILFVGHGPFAGDSSFEIAQKILSADVPELMLPKPVARVLRRCMARSPFERYPDASSLAVAMEEAAVAAALPSAQDQIDSLIKSELIRRAGMTYDELDLPKPAPPTASASVSPESQPRRIVRGAAARLSSTGLKKTMMGVAPGVGTGESTAVTPAPSFATAPKLPATPRMQTDDTTVRRDSDTTATDPDATVRQPPGIDAAALGAPPVAKHSPMPIASPEPPLPAPSEPVSKPATLSDARSLGDSDRTNVFEGRPPGSSAISDAAAAGAGGMGLSGKGLKSLAEQPGDLFSGANRLPESMSGARPLPESIGADQVNSRMPAGLPGGAGGAPQQDFGDVSVPRRSGRLVLVLVFLVVFAGGGFATYKFLLSQDDAVATTSDGKSSDGKTSDGKTSDGKTAVAEDIDAGDGKTVAAKSIDAGDGEPAQADGGVVADVADAGAVIAVAADAAPPLDAAATTSPPSNATTLTIASKPEGAKIYLDGTAIGKTPHTMDASSDKHRIAILHEGHKLHLGHLEGGGNVNVELEPVSAFGGRAGIKVRCKKKNRYYVFVDGRDTGQLCPTERIGVTKGEHLVEIYDPITDARTAFKAAIKQTKRSHRVYVD